jgi:hypothetical protein
MTTINFLKNCKTAKPHNRITAKKGIALLVAIGTMIVIFIVGALAIYLTTRGLNITIGQTRYETAYEAAVASLEIGKARAEYLNKTMTVADTTETMQVGEYTSTLNVQRTATTAITLSGSALKFARAVADPGQTPSTGSYRTYYITTQSVGRSGEKVILEMLQRYTILAE